MIIHFLIRTLTVKKLKYMIEFSYANVRKVIAFDLIHIIIFILILVFNPFLWMLFIPILLILIYDLFSAYKCIKKMIKNNKNYEQQKRILTGKAPRRKRR